MSDHIITAPDGAEFTTSEIRESLTAYRSVLDGALDAHPEVAEGLALHDGVAGIAVALLDEVERLTADEVVSV